MKRPFKFSFIIGLFAVIINILLFFVFPSTANQLPEHFRSPIIALEFAQSEAEVVALFGPPEGEDRATLITQMDRGNQLDFVFIALYGLFLLFFGIAAAKTSGQNFFFTASVLAVMVMIFDVLENVQLFSITSKIGMLSLDENLEKLQLYTWAKWGGLSLILGILGMYLIGKKQATWTKGIGGLAIIAFVLCIISFFYRPLIEPYAILANLVMWLLFGYAFWRFLKKN